MAKEIKPICVSGLDCFTNTVLTLVNLHWNEYQKALWDAWLFCYDENAENIAISIRIPTQIFMDNLVKYYGVEIKKYKVESSDIISEIQHQIDINGPIMICIDTFYCPWYENFGQSHSTHIFIISGYSDDGFRAYDTVPIRVDIMISYENVKQGFVWLRVVGFCTERKRLEVSLNNFCRYIVERKIRLEEIENFKKFISLLTFEKIQNEVTKEGYVWSIPLLKYIRRVAGSREHMADVLKYVNQNKPDDRIGSILDEFRDLIKTWGKITNTMYKFKYKNTDKKLYDRIIKYFWEAYKKEQQVFKYMLEEKYRNSPKLDISMSGRKRYAINLPYDYSSHFFESDDFTRSTPLPLKDIVEAIAGNNIFFQIKGNNCVKCNNQRVITQKKNVKRILFIGYSTWGNQVEDFSVLDMNGTYICGEVGLSDWCYDPNFAEKILWQGDFLEKKTGDPYKGRIFETDYEFSDLKDIDTIILPKNKNMILFSVVVEVSNET